MSDMIAMLAEKAPGSVELTSLPDVLKEQRLKAAVQQLKDIAKLTDSLSQMGEELAGLSRRKGLELKAVKPLQEKTRIATALIRNHVYLNEMRVAAEKTVLETLGERLAGEGEKENKSDENLAAPAAGSAPSETIASLARVKKNQRRRNAYREAKKKNKSDEKDLATEDEIRRVQETITRARAMAEDTRSLILEQARSAQE